MKGYILLGLMGISGGFIVAGGVIALLIGLRIITRYAGLTHTGKNVRFYETFIFFGAVFGTLMTVYQVSIPVGTIGLAILGFCSGIFVGSWILALAEIVNIFPIFFRRVGLVKGLSWVVISIAAGKTAGSLLHFYMRW